MVPRAWCHGRHSGWCTISLVANDLIQCLSLLSLYDVHLLLVKEWNDQVLALEPQVPLTSISRSFVAGWLVPTASDC